MTTKTKSFQEIIEALSYPESQKIRYLIAIRKETNIFLAAQILMNCYGVRDVKITGKKLLVEFSKGDISKTISGIKTITRYEVSIDLNNIEEELNQLTNLIGE